MNQEAFIAQLEEERGVFTWISEKFSSHPHLPKRMNAIDNWLNPEEKRYLRRKR
ncbi:hypothetical protein [Bacillus massilioanorexius]|uniref:hypothetical protein n=1 Tax=Bacillus massilioanorexius TaxID=1468413 RepID=UPI0002E183A1|nr:hypothetical protein [Bacillus massilioanorexius]